MYLKSVCRLVVNTQLQKLITTCRRQRFEVKWRHRSVFFLTSSMLFIFLAQSELQEIDSGRENRINYWKACLEAVLSCTPASGPPSFQGKLDSPLKHCVGGRAGGGAGSCHIAPRNHFCSGIQLLLFENKHACCVMST